MWPRGVSGHDLGAGGDLSERSVGGQQQQRRREREPTLAQVHALPLPPAENSPKQDTERDGKRTVRGLLTPAYH